MWLLPSRQRPENLKRFFDAYHKTKADSPGVVWLDEDDADNYRSINVPNNWCVIIHKRLDGTGAITNKFFEMFPEETWYGLLGDDVIPRTEYWDKKLIEAAGDDGVAYGNDLLAGEKIATHPVVGGEMVRELGWLALPGCKRIYIDSALQEFAWRKGKLHYLPDVIIEHMHFSNGKSPMDETYRKTHNSEDKAIYDEWLKTLDKPVTFVCVNQGNYCGRGAEYVNILFDMVRRNLADGYPGKFVCYTDDSRGLSDSVVSRPLPGNLQGWFNKLYLFKEGEFEEGERIIFLDLDTCITGSLDKIIQYDGEFACLQDFYVPNRYATGIMMWRGGFGKEIWDSYEREGFPTGFDFGDMAWINTVFAEEKYIPNIIQKLFKGSICSFKDHAREGIPESVKIVCFHGEPRPHDADNWVPYVWKIGGGTCKELEIVCNVDEGELARHIKASLKRKYPWIQLTAPHSQTALIIGGGPSLKYDIADIRERQKRGALVFATNGTFNWLVDKGIIPDCHVMLDARKENKQFVPKTGINICYYASQCHEEIFKIAENQRIIMWHPLIEGILDIIGDNTGDALVGGGYSVGIKSITLAYTLGFRNIHLYGLDSSYENGEHHAYKQSLNDSERTIEVQVGNEKFHCAAWMVSQADHFKDLLPALLKENVTLTTHGYGLVPYLAQQLAA